MGAIPGSRERSQSTLSPPIGFDPERGDAEMLAILMWDFFGPQQPRTMFDIQHSDFAATEEEVRQYRVCANHIADSLRFYRNIEMDTAERVLEQDDTIGTLCEALGEAAKWMDESEAACAALGTGAAHITAKLYKRRAQQLRTAILRACAPEDPNL